MLIKTYLFSGEVWPGPCVFPDFTQSKTRSWWAHLVKEFVSNGVDGIWNDMNEPAVFKVISYLAFILIFVFSNCGFYSTFSHIFTFFLFVSERNKDDA